MGFTEKEISDIKEYAYSVGLDPFYVGFHISKIKKEPLKILKTGLTASKKHPHDTTHP